MPYILTRQYFVDLGYGTNKNQYILYFNPLSANPEKWSNTLKQIVGNLPTICLSVFDHFMNLALKGLTRNGSYNMHSKKTQSF